jgi:2-hydroxychromene-2-carboxylate isomerase
VNAGGPEQSSRCTFYFDLGSPYAYLTAERVSGLFSEGGL